jgi:hypothetical protein
VAVDAGDDGLPAVQYAVSELIRPGDVLHVCHVAAVLPPATSISHGEMYCLTHQLSEVPQHAAELLEHRSKWTAQHACFRAGPKHSTSLHIKLATISSTSVHLRP